MQTFNVIKEYKIQDNFKNKQIQSIFDIEQEKITINETHNLYYDEIKNWQIGVIFGNSGSGKTSLAKEIAQKENIKLIEKKYLE